MDRRFLDLRQGDGNSRSCPGHLWRPNGTEELKPVPRLTLCLFCSLRSPVDVSAQVRQELSLRVSCHGLRILLQMFRNASVVTGLHRTNSTQTPWVQSLSFFTLKSKWVKCTHVAGIWDIIHDGIVITKHRKNARKKRSSQTHGPGREREKTAISHPSL